MFKFFFVSILSLSLLNNTQAQDVLLGPRVGFTTDMFFAQASGLSIGTYIHTHNFSLGTGFKWLPKKGPMSLEAGIDLVGKTIYNKGLRMETIRSRYRITAAEVHLGTAFHLTSRKKANKLWTFPIGATLSLNRMTGLAVRTRPVQSGVNGASVTVLGDELKRNFVYPAVRFGFGQLHQNLKGGNVSLQWRIVANLPVINIFPERINVELQFEGPDTNVFYQESLQGRYSYLVVDLTIFFGLGKKKAKMEEL